MEVQFNRHVTYKSRVGEGVIVEVTRRTQCYAVVELTTEEDSPYPIITKTLIQRSDDGREFMDFCIRKGDGKPCYSRIWATDTVR